MIKVYPKGTTLEQMRTSNGLCVLKQANEVCISQEINATPVLTFAMTTDSKSWQFIRQNNLVLCDGQIYRIYKKSRQKDSKITRTVTALHVISEASQRLILTFPKQIGKTPKEIMSKAFENTPFIMVTALPNGMKWVTEPTDFIDDISKVTPMEITKQLIEKLGKGELYINNYEIALVEKLISNPNTVNATTKLNVKSISDEEDGTDIITRLYPFGKDDLPLSGDVPYVESPLIDELGEREGYKEYKDITDPEELRAKAEYEFSEENPKRIDMPNLSYNIGLIDLYKIYGERYKIGLGDSLKITDFDLGLDTVQRIVKYQYYPYSAQSSSVTLGNPPKTFTEALKTLVSSEEKFSHALNGEGNLKTSFLENLIKNKSEYITDAILANEVTVHKTGDLWFFENAAGDRAIAIVDGQLAISDTKNADGSWVWTTFIDGKSVTADVINSGTLNTDLIELKSTDGKTYLHGNEFRMVAEDGATVSIRATDGENGIGKGLQIIENFNEDGTPKNYSIYDSKGYRRYINGNRIQTYTISRSGYGKTLRPAYDKYEWGTYVYLECAGDYFYQFATAYNDENITDDIREQMLSTIYINYSEITAKSSYSTPYQELKEVESVKVVAVNPGSQIPVSNNYHIVAENKGAIFYWYFYSSQKYQPSDSWWDESYCVPKLLFQIHTTMDVEGVS